MKKALERGFIIGDGEDQSQYGVSEENFVELASLVDDGDKYNGEIIGNPEIHARFLKKMGDAFYKKEPKRAAGFYKKSVGIRFDAKVFGKMLISAARGGGFIGE